MQRRYLMRKKAVLLSLVLCTFIFNCLVLPTRVEAMEPISICSLSAPITEDNIINVEVIDGELYIDVLTEIEPNQAIIMTEIGPCPSSYKFVTRSITRAELINMRNELENTATWTSGVLATLIGAVSVPAGVLATVLTTANKSMMLKAIQGALDTTKTNFKMTSKFQCEEGNLGSRGIVHRYRLVDVTIV